MAGHGSSDRAHAPRTRTKRQQRLALKDLRRRERELLESALNCLPYDGGLEWFQSQVQKIYKPLLEGEDIKYYFDDPEKALDELRHLRDDVDEWLAGRGAENRTRREAAELHELELCHMPFPRRTEHGKLVPVPSPYSPELWEASRYSEPVVQWVARIFHIHVRMTGLYNIGRCRAPRLRVPFARELSDEQRCRSYEVREGHRASARWCSEKCRKRLRRWEKECELRDKRRSSGTRPKKATATRKNSKSPRKGRVAGKKDVRR